MKDGYNFVPSGKISRQWTRMLLNVCTGSANILGKGLDSFGLGSSYTVTTAQLSCCSTRAAMDM